MEQLPVAPRSGETVPARTAAPGAGAWASPGEDVAVLEVSDVRKSFVDKDFETHVLKGVTFSLGRGEMVAMLGPSGSGKSTLLSILGTLMKPTSGRFRMLGRELTTLGERDLSDFRNQQIGFIFQYHHLLPDFTALENVLFPHAARVGRETRAGRERAAMLLDRVGLRDRMHYRATRLSGGQKQRVAIARALMNQPALVLADEPTGNLDRENADQVFALMTEIQRETGTTFLLSTHDRELAERCGRRIYIRGGVVVDAPAVAETAPARAAAAMPGAAPMITAVSPEADPVRAPAAARAPWRVITGDALPVIDRTGEAIRAYGSDDDSPGLPRSRPG
jgi:lipoprotein-releasing system ATP-binding protein